MSKEPVVWTAAIAALIELIIPVLLIFGIVNWTDEQVGAVMALVIGAASIIGGLFARSKVTPVTS